MHKLKPLKPGSTIGIAASSSPFDRAAFETGVKWLESLGYKTHFRPDIFDRRYYLAGTDDRRASELIELLENPQIDALLFARGGYGMMRLLPHLEKDLKSPTSKIIVGYSDITTLFLYLQQRHGLTPFYGPVVTNDLFEQTPPLTRQSFLGVLQGQIQKQMQAPETRVIKEGLAEGILTGGCLSLVVASLGTCIEIETQNSILFLEDTKEKPYSVDRMLTQLKLAGKFKGVKGMVFGNFVEGGEVDHIQEAITDVLSDFSGPILFNFPAGHGPVKLTLPLGVRAKIQTQPATLEILESPFE